MKTGPPIFFFPLLPWFGVHLLGGYLGERFSQYNKSSDLYWQIGKRLGTLACHTAVLAALAIKIIYTMLGNLGCFTPTADLYRFVSLGRSTPPRASLPVAGWEGSAIPLSAEFVCRTCPVDSTLICVRAEIVGGIPCWRSCSNTSSTIRCSIGLVTKTSLHYPLRWRWGSCLCPLLDRWFLITWLDRCKHQSRLDGRATLARAALAETRSAWSPLTVHGHIFSPPKKHNHRLGD